MKGQATTIATILAGLTALAGPTGALGAQAQTQVNVTHDPKYRWGEPEIAVNPKNPANLVITLTRSAFTYACQTAKEQKCQMVQSKSGYAQPYGLLFNAPAFSAVVAFASFDGGKSWKGVAMPGLPGHPELVESGHPTVTVGPDGTFYVGWNMMHFEDGPTTPVSHGAVVVSKSSDGGRTWSAPVISGVTVDHPYISASLATGQVHIAAGAPGTLGSMSTADPKAIAGKIRDRFLASSSDGVRWSAPQPFGVPAGGSSMSAGHAVLATAFRSTNPETCGAPAPAGCTVFQTTADGGAHWSRQLVPVPATYRGEPLVAADPTRAGQFAIALSMKADTEFHIYRTRDSGKSWSAPTVVTDDSARTHALGWIAYSSRGVLGMAWKTMDAAPAGAAGQETPAAPFNIWAAISRDGGTVFSRPLKVSSMTSPAPDPDRFAGSIGGHTTIALSADQAFVTWGDWRAGEIGVFFSAIPLKAFTNP